MFFNVAFRLAGGAVKNMATTSERALLAEADRLKKRSAEVRQDLREARKRTKTEAGSETTTATLCRLGLLSTGAGSLSSPSTTASSSSCPEVSTATPARKSAAQVSMHLILVVFALAKFRPEVAVAFTLGRGRGRRYAACGHDCNSADVEQSLTAAIENAYIDAPLNQCTDMLDDPAYYGNSTKLFKAIRYVMEYDVYHWVLSQNCDFGVAPVPPMMFAKALEFIPVGTPAVVKQRLVSSFEWAGVGARSWLINSRARWGATFGKLAVGPEVVDLADLQSKAGSLFQRAVYV